MDDTSELVSDLLQKVAELDNKVQEYRQDMAQEFRRYLQGRLRNLPGHVSSRVENLLAQQLQNYPALGLSLDHDFMVELQAEAGETTPDEKTWSSVGHLSPPTSPQSPSISDDAPRSPHEREHEFHGLFTPSYLPLLEAVQRPSPTPTILSPQVPKVKESNNSQDPSPITLGNVDLSRPDPVRRHTEDTISSVASDDSAARYRRSALRRSSSSSTKAQSPRRVRFDVEGEEVLPTSSPPVSPRTLDHPSGNPTSLLDESYNTIVISEDSDLFGSSPPMPKKITSTDRLKAMARNSTEDTSKWEVVGSLEPTDDDEEDELVMASINGRKSNDAYHNATSLPIPGNTAYINDSRLPTQLGAPLAAVREVEENEDANKTTGVDELLMPPLSSFKGKKRFSPSLEKSAESSSKASESQEVEKGEFQSSVPSNFVGEPVLDEEDMFEFEDNPSVSSSKADEAKSKKYIDEEEDANEEEADVTPLAEKAVLFSTSPGIPVVKPATPTPASLPSHHTVASAGSYRGKPFSIGVIRDPELHKKAAEMGDFYTFVGSVDGRSGVDDSSYKPDMTYFNGTPRSLSERLMMEDLDETRRNTKANERD
ncbi:uncharacterized protein GGS25DRAFT_517793 [Hypoxylon fragiforme]|uniref:uncharacterized protein n=1 Tax=Hypoxylon fragiforme TaxID=63214 RepID=UPI0020C5DC9E|nr:uncharacterized protein GGS25DRAFT_517793 [Hypoxylon fragiforme]KAI2612096.1 hypothetical protein GGS25DRAFT_517793 [Hypoxylon fragiforme]